MPAKVRNPSRTATRSSPIARAAAAAAMALSALWGPIRLSSLASSRGWSPAKITPWLSDR